MGDAMTPISFFRLTGFPLLAALCLTAQTPPASTVPAPPPAVAWHDLKTLPLEGKPWTDTQHYYDRLPAKAEKTVRSEVWGLSHDSAGLRYRFVSNSKIIRARWKLRRESIALPHMPATGVSGLDLYVRDGERWHWVGAGRPLHSGVNEGTLAQGLNGESHEFLLYLPLYNGVDSVEIGVPEAATFAAAPDRYASRKPILFYGTSILQGGCASRPGMAYPSIVGRKVDWPIINLGFSGNAKSEPEVAALLAELDPSVYVLDSLPNLTPAEAQERLEPFIRKIRAAHPKTPIVLVEHVAYSDAPFVATRMERYTGDNRALKQVYEKLTREGDTRLFYVPSNQLFGADDEDTVDGTHPTDLGFVHLADGVLPAVRQALAAAQ